VSVLPAIVNVPVRALVAVFAATVNDAVPLPEVVPLGAVIHVALLSEVHPQPLAVVTVVLPDPPAADMLCADDDSANVQGVVVENVNVFDGVLAEVPPGPTAATSAK
jgi:hypothetical protein